MASRIRSFYRVHTPTERTDHSTRREEGSAVIEFVFASVALLVPIVYLALTLSQLQAGAFAAQATAVDVARIHSRYPDSADAKADAITRMNRENFRLDSSQTSYSISCDGDCTEPGTLVTAQVTIRVRIPGSGLLFGSGGAGTIALKAEHTDEVSPYYRAGQR